MPEIERLLREDAQAWRDGLAHGQGSCVELPVAVPRAARPRRRWEVGIAAVVVLIVLAAGAVGTRSLFGGGERDSISAAGATRDPLRPSPLGQDVPTVPAQVVPFQPSALSMPWRFVRMSADGRQVTVRYITGDGSCVFPIGFAVLENSRQVLIEPMSRPHLEPGQNACASMIAYAQAVVTLAAPLGGRALLHPVVSPDWRGLPL
ncbi:MAG TPA: hypothetical protein VMB79_05345 [Jatrophihabitans sp.]|nr:hypothetical protein [Jatrophihabitans sp.]